MNETKLVTMSVRMQYWADTIRDHNYRESLSAADGAISAVRMVNCAILWLIWCEIFRWGCDSDLTYSGVDFQWYSLLSQRAKQMIDYIEVKNEKNPAGTYDYRIKWIPPEGDGYIVQYVEIDDPLRIIGNYNGPYYEAWIVKNGKTESDEYDDKFNNDGGGLVSDLVIDVVQRKLMTKDISNSYIEYRCKVF